jgi:hypothetical protein
MAHLLSCERIVGGADEAIGAAADGLEVRVAHIHDEHVSTHRDLKGGNRRTLESSALRVMQCVSSALSPEPPRFILGTIYCIPRSLDGPNDSKSKVLRVSPLRGCSWKLTS